jgi:mono/diheme cytochrome c family protein
VRWLGVVALAVLAACDHLPGRPLESERPLRPHEVRDFAQLWGENCAGCHGAAGTLGPATALANPVYQAWADQAAVGQVVARGVPGTAMPGFVIAAGGSLTDEQVEIIVREMRTRWAPAPAPPGLPAYAAAPGDAARGAAVYRARCAACHDPGGTGTPHGGSVVDADYLALVSDQALRTAVVTGRPDLGMPDWRGVAPDVPLTAEEVADVVAWMASHRGGGV